MSEQLEQQTEVKDLTVTECGDTRRASLVKMIISLMIILVIIPAVIVVGMVVLDNKQYDIISIVLAFVACVPFFISFECKRVGSRELVVIAVMVALSVVSRLIFAPIPAFKPISAIVIIAGIAFGMESGFMVGALSAILSNIYFGQGPWTPFQMLAWGIVGLLAGLLFRRNIKPSYIMLIVIAIIGGVLYSLLLDIWTVLSVGQVWSFDRFGAVIMTSLPFMGMCVASYIVFLLLLARPMTTAITRIKLKYGLFSR